MDGRVGWEIMNLLIRKNERIVKDLIKKRHTPTEGYASSSSFFERRSVITSRFRLPGLA
jgi:hypothetical protein